SRVKRTNSVDLSSFIDRNAAFSPDKVAIAFEGDVVTYAALSDRIATAARALEAEFSVGRGDRVGILSLNRPDYLVLLYACARLGATLVPLNWRLAVAEQLFILSDAGVKVLAVEEALAAVVVPLVQAQPETRIVGLDFSPTIGMSLAELLSQAEGDG